MGYPASLILLGHGPVHHSGARGKSDQIRPESLSSFHRNGCPGSTGFTVQFRPESVSRLGRNTQASQVSLRMASQNYLSHLSLRITDDLRIPRRNVARRSPVTPGDKWLFRAHCGPLMLHCRGRLRAHGIALTYRLARNLLNGKPRLLQRLVKALTHIVLRDEGSCTL